MSRRASPTAYAMAARHEGNRLRAYRDPVGRWTIGRGHIGPAAREGNVITEAESLRLFHDDMAEAERTIARHVHADVLARLPQPAYDALASATFNLGDQLFRNRNGSRTGVWRALHESRWLDVASELRRWVYAGGRRLPGLEIRRAEEAQLWLSAFEPDDRSEGGVIGELPTPRPLLSTRTVAGAVVSGAGGLAAVGESVTDAAQTAQMAGAGVPVLQIVAAVLIVLGLGLTIWGRLAVRQRSGE